MPVLKAQADILTNTSLQRGVIEVLITRGAAPVIEQMPFKAFEGSAYAFNAELTLPTDHSSRDPYGSTIPGGVGTRQRISVESGMLARNADTAKLDVVGKSDINDQRANDILLASKKLADDLVYAVVNEIHDDSGTDFNLKGWEYWLSFYGSSFTEQIVYGTDDGLSTGTAQNLSLRMVDDLLSRKKGDEFDAIYSDRESMITFMNLYNLAGGNTAPIFMSDNFGQSSAVFAYRGKPWYVLDHAGGVKTTAASDATATDATLTVDRTSATGDPHFPGFSSLDVGRTITVTGAGTAGGLHTTTIASVTDDGEVEMTDVAVTTSANATLTIAATRVIYAIRFGEEDGFTAIYHTNRGIPANAGVHYGPIAGFDAEDLGILESAPTYRTRLDWFGNFVNHNPYAIARLSHFLA